MFASEESRLQTGLSAPQSVRHVGALSLKPQAGPAQVDFVAGAKLFAAAVAGWDFDGAAVAEDARAEFAFVVAEAVVAVVQADVGVPARYGRGGFVGAFFENDVVAADY